MLTQDYFNNKFSNEIASIRLLTFESDERRDDLMVMAQLKVHSIHTHTRGFGSVAIHSLVTCLLLLPFMYYNVMQYYPEQDKGLV